MKKLTLAAVLLLAALLLLTGCQSNEQRFSVATNVPANVQDLYANIPTDTPPPDWDVEIYDPTLEEDDEEFLGAVATASVYAGATPVLLDPIDKPTATPVPPLTVTYETVTAVKLGLNFSAPTGWKVDVEDANTFVLVNPDSRMDYRAFISITTEAAGKQLSKSELDAWLKNKLSDIRLGFGSFSPTNTADRTLLGTDGKYADYTARTADGAEAAGRVQCICINKTVYTLHISYPLTYRDTYKDGVYRKLRETIKSN